MAPTRLSYWEGFAFSRSASRSDRGAGRNSSISTNSSLCAFSTTFAGKVGRPFSIRTQDLDSFFWSAPGSASSGRMAAKGFNAASGGLGVPWPGTRDPQQSQTCQNSCCGQSPQLDRIYRAGEEAPGQRVLTVSP